MTRFKILNIPSYYNPILGHLRNFHYKAESVVIAAAARTPWGKYQGQLSSLSAWQLGQLAVEAAVKQSAIPLEQIQQIFMNETPKLQNDKESEFIFSNFLKKAKYTPITVGDCDEHKIVSFQNALEFLKAQQQTAVVLGGLESATQNEIIKNKQLEAKKSHTDVFNEVSKEFVENYIARSALIYSKSQKEAAFDSELVPLTVQQKNCKRRVIKEITQDEVDLENNRSFQYGDGAAALVLTTLANARELKLSPLAIIIDFEYLRNSSNILYRSSTCVEKLLSRIKLDPHQIQHWEIEDCIPSLVASLKNHFNLNLSLINPHGGSVILGQTSAASLTRLSAHLTHSLNHFEYGCVICCSFPESLALIIQKLPLPLASERMPLVTLYTKDPCPLCDTLIEELELYFPGEYELEKVFVDTKDNLRFLRLYRFDIPVVFLNNQFLCMHRLNHKLFRKRLDLLNKNKA